MLYYLDKLSKFLFWGIILIPFGICYINIYLYFHKVDPFLTHSVGQKIELLGIVVGEPVQSEKSTQIIVKTDYGKILLFANSYPKVEYGDKISFEGKLKKPKKFKTDSGRDFNYPGYLSKDGIFFVESYPDIIKISSNNGNFIKEKLFDLKHSIIHGMENVVPYPESALLQGLTVAGKKALPTEINDEFKRAGVSHIVVLSGYNVTIVALIIIRLLSRFPRKVSFTAGTIGIICFCILAGGTSTIVRAGIMSFLFLFSKFVRRKADPNRLLAIAGLAMVLQNPLILLYDTSFHLSFLATFGLINVSPLIYKRLTIIPDSFILKEIIAASLGVEIFLIPYLAYSIGSISIVALASNILLLPYIPVTMLFGFISSSVSFISPNLSFIPSFLSLILLRYELGIVHIMSLVPYALIKTASPLWIALSFYIFALGVFITRQIFLERRANLDSQKMLQHT